MMLSKQRNGHEETGDWLNGQWLDTNGMRWLQGEQSPKQRLEELRILLPPWMITSDPQANLHVCGGRCSRAFMTCSSL